MPFRKTCFLLAALLVCALSIIGCGTSGNDAAIHDVERSQGTGSMSTGIAGYGRPASQGQEARVEAMLRGYLAALKRGEGRQACRYLSAQLRSQTAGLGARGRGNSTSCAAQISSMVAGGSPGKQPALRVSAVRIGDGQGFVIYRRSGGRREFMPLLEEDGEDGELKLAALGGSALP